MRVALVHSEYATATPGGENAIVADELAALRKAGHEVHLVVRRTDEVRRRPLHALRSAAEVVVDRAADPWSALRALRPDVVHVHNLFPNYRRSGLAQLARDVPVVATLHNYRAFCASALLSRPGAPTCRECPDGDRFAAVRHRCYRGSAVATLPLALSRRFADDEVLTASHLLAVLSLAMTATYASLGVDSDKLVEVPNFVPDARAAEPGPGGAGFAFVGRLTPEKGILQLVREWPDGVALAVVGTGPEEQAVRELARPGVTVHGAVPPEQVRALLARSRGLVVSSTWAEGLPLVYLEALAAGTPVLALETNGVADLVRRDGSGATASWAEVGAAVLAADSTFAGLRSSSRAAFDLRYSEARHVAALEHLYRGAAERADQKRDH